MADEHCEMIISDLIRADKYDPIIIQDFLYPIFITDNHIQIDCEIHTFEEWWNFSDLDIVKMNGKKALVFWREWKSPLMRIVKKQRS